MKELEEFNTMEELLQYKKELETRITDEDILEEVLENVWNELLNINSLVNDIYSVKYSNANWLAIVYALLGTREDIDQYKIKVVNEIGSKKKIYTLDKNLHQAIVEEDNMDKDYNIVMFTNNKKDGTDVIYDKFSGEFDLENYLETIVNYSKVIEMLAGNGLTKKEVRVLNRYIFDGYKENVRKGNVKTRRVD